MLARERSDHGELRRVAAAMPQTVDGHTSDSLFVAGSNHPDLLASAVWPRFDGILELGYPDGPARQEILRLDLRSVSPDFDVAAAAEPASGHPPTGVRRTRPARKRVMAFDHIPCLFLPASSRVRRCRRLLEGRQRGTVPAVVLYMV